MPHSIQDEVYEPSASTDASSQSNDLGTVQKGKCCQPSHVLNPLEPYELDGTPIEQRRNAISFQHGILGLIPMPPEVRESVKILVQEDNCIYMIDCPTGVRPEAQNLSLVVSAQEYLPEYLVAAALEPVSYEDFIQLLNDEGLTWLLAYVDQLDGTADFAVAPTADPNKKRCKVGRPKGKILKKNQGDDLDRRICCMHLDEVGFRIQVDAQHRDQWTCYPPNADQDVEVEVE